MKLYLDDNSADPVLTRMLLRAGHTVVCPADVGLAGASDARHLRHAVGAGLVLLTADRVDFRDLHDLVLACGGVHPGIVVVRYENDPRRDMKPKHIAGAVGKLERSGVDLTGQLTILNQWR
jgi:predicted nuclease of predicted toxin-antitoxin system